MVFNKKADEGDAPFNMAMMFYFRLNELLADKDRAAIGNNIRHYYQCLVAILNNIHFQIHDEKDKLKAIEDGLKKSENLLTGALPPDKNLATQYEHMRTWEARKALMDVDRQMMILMDQKKMIFPRMETTAGLDKIREKYGLGDTTK